MRINRKEYVKRRVKKMKRINKISVITMLMLITLVPSSSIVYAIDASSSESAEGVISADTV